MTQKSRVFSLRLHRLADLFLISTMFSSERTIIFSASRVITSRQQSFRARAQDGDRSRVTQTVCSACSSWFFCHSDFADRIRDVLLDRIEKVREESCRGGRSSTSSITISGVSRERWHCIYVCMCLFGLLVSMGLCNAGTFWNTVSLNLHKGGYFCDHEYELRFFFRRSCITACM